jgi:hypothetical protein
VASADHPAADEGNAIENAGVGSHSAAGSEGAEGTGHASTN